MLCVGGATVDRSYRLSAPLRAETSNPVSGRRGSGGVARNVAENLSRLGAEVGLVSRVGDDESGRALLAALDSCGIDRRGVVAVREATTAEYVAVLTPAGDLALGLADMAIFDRLTAVALVEHAALFSTADWVFADCNLPEDALAVLARRGLPGARYRLAVDAVSVAKSARLPDRLDGVDLLFLNREEAGAVLARRGHAEASPTQAAAALVGAGAGAAVLTLGKQGAAVASDRGVLHVPAVPARPVDVTGAGDALVAATLFGLTCGASLSEAVVLGCWAAAHTVECRTAVSPDLSRVLLPVLPGAVSGS